MYLVALCLLATALAAPLTTYDQRQEGDFNVHAHLENFIIVLIPSGNSGLLDFAAKSSPGKLNQIKRLIGHSDGYSHVKHVEKPPADAEVIEISGDNQPISPPARNMEPPVKDSAEPQVVVAESPSVTLTKDEPTVANEKEQVKVPVQESSEARARAAKLERLREGLEECLPARDGSGGCASARLHNRNSKGFPSQELLRSLRFGLSPAN
ncbi:uncharacterized protein [Anabrus simplex]|uniref:uncharacterized protein n=1 Tax=Anabrus simplex TaxID=316456 RepID=UPI0034DD1A91